MTLRLNELYSLLEASQPFYTTPHSSVRVDLGEGWAKGVDPKKEGTAVDAYVSTKEDRYQLSSGSLLSLAGSLSMGRDILFASPPKLIEPLLNHWLSTVPDEDGPSFTINDDQIATAVVRAPGELPGYPRQYIQAMVELLTDLSGNEVRVHPWVRSTVKETHVYLVVDGLTEVVGEDTWHGGVGFSMSCAGSIVPSIYPVLVRREDDAIVFPPNLHFRYKKSKHGGGLENTLSWVEDSVGVLYTVLERELRVFKWLKAHDTSQHAGNIVSDVLKEVSLPRVLKSDVIEHSISNDDSSGYGLLEDILHVQDFENEDQMIPEKVGLAAGKLWTVLGNRCDECHQLHQ